MTSGRGWTLVVLLWLVACGPARPATSASAEAGGDPTTTIADAPWRATVRDGGRQADPSATVLLRGARLLIGDGRTVERGHVLIREGKIAAVGDGDGEAPAGTTIVDASGKYVTPGLIDTHSHLGVYPIPQAAAHLDGNEMTAPVTPSARAVDGVWTQDPGFERALAGGVTALQVLPGSANLIGGRGVTLKLHHANDARAMKMVGAPDGLKMACGENPKRVYGSRNQVPSTRMGNLALQRAAFLRARRLIDEWDQWREEEQKRTTEEARSQQQYQRERVLRQDRAAACDSGEVPAERCAEWRNTWAESPLLPPVSTPAKLPPARDLELETLAEALEGRILVHVHCYRADDMKNLLAMADEVGLRIRAFHHALEAYKIRGELTRREIGVATWADWWGFKMEAYDGIPENLALVAVAGGRANVHSDSREGITRLNQEAAKGMYAGRQGGLDIDEGEAIKWVTLNAAWILGIDDRVGSLAVGKDADVVLWDKSPFSVYARAERVWVDGVERLDRANRSEPWSDFEATP